MLLRVRPAARGPRLGPGTLAAHAPVRRYRQFDQLWSGLRWRAHSSRHCRLRGGVNQRVHGEIRPRSDRHLPDRQLDGPLTVTAWNGLLYGDGPGSRIAFNTLTNHGFNFAGVSDVELRDLDISYSPNVTTRNLSNLIQIVFSSNITVANLSLHNGNSIGLALTNDNNVTVQGVTIENFLANGILGGNISDASFANIACSGVQDACFEVSYYDSNSPNVCDRIALDGLTSSGDYAGVNINACHHVSVSNFVIENTKLTGLYVRQDAGTTILAYPDNITITGGTISNTGMNTGSDQAGIMLLTDTPSTNKLRVSISNVVVTNTPSWGLQLLDSNNYDLQLNNVSFDTVGASTYGGAAAGGLLLEGDQVYLSNVTVKNAGFQSLVVLNTPFVTASNFTSMDPNQFASGTDSILNSSTGIVDFNNVNLYDSRATNRSRIDNAAASGPQNLTNVNSYAASVWAGILSSNNGIVTSCNVIASGCQRQESPSNSAGVTVGLLFVPITPCRVADTRRADGVFGGPTLSEMATRDFAIPNSACNVPNNAGAYSLNVTVVPKSELGFLSIWPTGQGQPLVSTLNSDGRVKANAAIVPAGINGAVSVYVSDPTDVIVDINGYFAAPDNTPSLAFYPLTPCRAADTRNAAGALGGPVLAGSQTRHFPIQSSGCGAPATAQAYSLNFTAVPRGPVGYISTWPTGQSQPLVSTLNASTGAVTANAAIVPAGTNGGIDVYTSDASDLVIDINGYFGPPATGGLSLYPVTPCRLVDTRNPPPGTPLVGTLLVDAIASSCATPATAQALVVNATVVPPGDLGFLTLWPHGVSMPLVSTLNAEDGAVTSNMAIVPVANGSVDVFSSSSTHLILDVSSYFAP